MEKEIKYHPKALAKFFKTARYYDGKVPGLGADFMHEIDSVINEVQKDPHRQRSDALGVRSWRVKRFWFRVYYVDEPTRIRILAIVHPRRRPGYWRRRIND